MNRIIRKKKKRKKREKNSEKILDLRWQCNPNNETILFLDFSSMEESRFRDRNLGGGIESVRVTTPVCYKRFPIHSF